MGIFDLEQGYGHLSLDGRSRLLQHCAHFDLLMGAASAASAVQALGRAKKKHVEAVQGQRLG